ncbi:hypothetical protein Leryth_017502 [Lithospermum erythrorhizon]|nr:hypothetical protein Leryth_017502 [Lithospermum erythrorhizon]
MAIKSISIHFFHKSAIIPASIIKISKHLTTMAIKKINEQHKTEVLHQLPVSVPPSETAVLRRTLD